MRRFTYSIATFMLLFCAAVCSPQLAAQSTPVVAADTIEFTATMVVPELDYNRGNFTYTLQDNTWKVQVCYTADSPFGTFTEADFYSEGGSGSFNYIRGLHSDLQFWTFRQTTISVTSELGATRIEVDALINNWGTWRRILAHGFIPAPAVADTVTMDLGQVAVQQDAFNNAIILEASNDDYHLAFGLGGQTILTAGNYYTVDLLLPELTNLHTQAAITPADAFLSVTPSGQYFDLYLSLRSDADTLYQISMHTGATIVTDTISVACPSITADDYSSSYGFVLLAGESADYMVSLALSPYAIEHINNMPVADTSFVYTYTKVVRKSDLQEVRITEATASVLSEIDPTGAGCRNTLWAELIGANGTLYVVTMPLNYSNMPEAVDTINVDFGDGVGRIDYSQGMGWMSLVLSKVADVDAHVVFYNVGSLKGTFDSDYFDYEGCYMTTYGADGLIRFADIKAAQISLDSIGDTLHITLDAITLGDTLYHMTAFLTPKYALTGDHVNYVLDYSDNCQMLAIREQTQDTQALYTLQFQYAEAWDEDGYPIGNNQQLFTFRFLQDGIDGIGGTFGYSDYTLDDSRYHFIVEDGVEIYLGPVAGTVTFTPTSEQQVYLGTTPYMTHTYTINAEFLAENGIIYSLSGSNILLCVDGETEQLLELSEQELTALEEVLSEQGLHVRKMLQNGILLIEKEGRTYDASGRLIR